MKQNSIREQLLMRDGDSILVDGFRPDAMEAAHKVPHSRPDVIAGRFDVELTV
jgi:hypothetical protein